jgi:hypothetical protein
MSNIDRLAQIVTFLHDLSNDERVPAVTRLGASVHELFLAGYCRDLRRGDTGTPPASPSVQPVPASVSFGPAPTGDFRVMLTSGGGVDVFGLAEFRTTRYTRGVLSAYGGDTLPHALAMDIAREAMTKGDADSRADFLRAVAIGSGRPSELFGDLPDLIFEEVGCATRSVHMSRVVMHRALL